MAVTYTTAVKTSRMTAVRDAIDGGGAAGRLEIGTAGMGTVLATITVPADSFAAASGATSRVLSLGPATATRGNRNSRTDSSRSISAWRNPSTSSVVPCTRSAASLKSK